MRITLRTTVAGPQGAARPGQTVDWPAADAQPLVEGGYAFLAAEPAAEGQESAGDETKTPPSPEDDGLEALTVPKLRARASVEGITGAGSMNKPALIEALRAAAAAAAEESKTGGEGGGDGQ